MDMTVGGVLRHKQGGVVAKRKWMGEQPKDCDLCHNPFGFKNTKVFIDGRTAFGPWAIMCEACHRDQNIGLGTGKGQKYNWDTLEKIDG